VREYGKCFNEQGPFFCKADKSCDLIRESREWNETMIEKGSELASELSLAGKAG